MINSRKLIPCLNEVVLKNIYDVRGKLNEEYGANIQTHHQTNFWTKLRTPTKCIIYSNMSCQKEAYKTCSIVSPAKKNKF